MIRSVLRGKRFAYKPLDEDGRALNLVAWMSLTVVFASLRWRFSVACRAVTSRKSAPADACLVVPAR
jgi:hypothetical protein